MCFCFDLLLLMSYNPQQSNRTLERGKKHMVLDSINHAENYFGLGPHFKTGLSWLIETDITGWEPGKYEIDGDDVFVFVQRYTTLDQGDCKAEAHEKW